MNPGNILPNEHFTGLISLESRPIRDIEEPAGFGGESDDVIVPAAVIATASVGNEDHFGFAVAVEVLSRVVLVENHLKPGRAEHHMSASVVYRRGTPVAIKSAVARRAE